MRNVLGELPVFLYCIYGGAAFGAAAFILRLPRKLLDRKPRRRKAGVKLLLLLLDLLLCAAGFAAAAGVLYTANGGEPRFYALTGFALGGGATLFALNALFFTNDKKDSK